uniref:Uncharacterized protein n=1 Tax=Avena sativa TaxID=4498 RepID=A0ACD5WQR1_AVESA
MHTYPEKICPGRLIQTLNYSKLRVSTEGAVDAKLMEIRSRMMLKPAPHPLAGEKVPLTVFDRVMDMFISSVRVYPAPAPSNETLKEGLLRAVVYLHLTGRLAVDGQGRRFLHLNDEGVLVVEAVVHAHLPDAFPDAADHKHLYPTPPEESVSAAPVLQIKLNRYKCGGLVIGMTCHHEAADGYSMSAFGTVWARAVRDGKDFVAPSPFVDRAATAVPRCTPAPVFDHRSIEFGSGQGSSRSSSCDAMDKIKNITVHFPAEFIAELKARVGGSTFECLLAHVWKRITVARGLRREEFTQVRLAVNCRGRANPPVPMDFLGREHGALGVPEAPGRGRAGLELRRRGRRHPRRPCSRGPRVRPVVRGLRQTDGRRGARRG